LTTKARPRGIQSVEIGFRVLLAVQAGPGPVSLKEIALRADLTASAAHNYLISLMRTGMVSSDQRGTYRLGPGAAALGLVALRQTDSFDILRTEAVLLQEETGHDATVSYWSEAGPVIIFRKEGIYKRSFELRIGHIHLLTTGAGNVFIAYQDLRAVRAVAFAELSAAGRSDDCDARLEDIRADVLRKGYAARRSITVPGYGSLSAPVWDADDAVIYALTVTGPVAEIDFNPNGVRIPCLLRGARRSSRQLGAPPKRWMRNHDA
jgi:DNA-binding IclR family transcriptional regulator